jgi:hypothetical protein
MKLSLEEVKALQPCGPTGALDHFKYQTPSGNEILLFEVQEWFLGIENNKPIYMPRPVLMSEAQRQEYIAAPEEYRDSSGKPVLAVISAARQPRTRDEIEQMLCA